MKHITKLCLLAPIIVILVVLLVYCLISNMWISVNQARLSKVLAEYENNYLIFSGSKKEEKLDETNKIIKLSKSNLVATITPTTTTTKSSKTAATTTTTTTTTIETPFKSDFLENKNKNLSTDYDLYNFDDISSEPVSDGEDEEEEETDETENSAELKEEDHSSSDFDDNTKKRSERELATGSKRYSSNDKQLAKVVDYVYIEKLWPLIKFKSLFSECIQFKKFYLKISTAYLNQPNKEPIIGTINYGKDLSEILKKKNINQCDTKQGQIKCILSQQCVQGKICDGIVDCDDQSDEQVCDSSIKCFSQTGGAAIQCDNRCWQYWHKCDQIPNCFDLSDELDESCFKNSYSLFSSSASFNLNSSFIHNNLPFTIGAYHYDAKENCFVDYFDFKSAQLIRKENLKYLTQSLADHIQETNNINYHLQLIYSLAFVSALLFSLLALISLLFIICFKKFCFQCPYWFYGFFIILTLLSCSFGLMTFLYQVYSNKQRTLDPLTRLPIENELIRLNPELSTLQEFGISFWIAIASTSLAFLGASLSCIVCCRLPSARHEDKEYKIMQLPTYT